MKCGLGQGVAAVLAGIVGLTEDDINLEPAVEVGPGETVMPGVLPVPLRNLWAIIECGAADAEERRRDWIDSGRLDRLAESIALGSADSVEELDLLKAQLAEDELNLLTKTFWHEVCKIWPQLLLPKYGGRAIRKGWLVVALPPRQGQEAVLWFDGYLDRGLAINLAFDEHGPMPSLGAILDGFDRRLHAARPWVTPA